MAKVLLVEDDKTLRGGYTELFQKAGHEVAAAADGKEALTVAADFKPEVILLDLQMPKLDGLGFLEAFKPAAGTDPQIVVFTNVEETDSIYKALKLGARGYLTKAEISAKGVVEAVESILKQEAA